MLFEEYILNIPTGPTYSNPTLSLVRFGNDYRPYFTIHDSEFPDFTSKTHSPSRVILGVTNPYFNKALQHWPNVIILDTDPDKNLKVRGIKWAVGGPRSIFTFLLFLIVENVSYQELFSELKNIVPN